MIVEKIIFASLTVEQGGDPHAFVLKVEPLQVLLKHPATSFPSSKSEGNVHRAWKNPGDLGVQPG